MRAKQILWSMMIAAAAVPAAAASPHYVVSAATVAAAISRMGVNVSPDQISLPADFMATTPTPMLKVRSVEKLDNKRLVARLECANSDECLPFFVAIHLDQGSESEIAAIASGTSQSLPIAQQTGGGLAVHSGASVTLMLDGDHVHIRIRAICLQGGTPGQMIRVSDTNHRLIYLAQVIDASDVKGMLK